MSVSFDGVGQVCATFLGSGLSEGQVVRMAGNGTVCQASLCGNGQGGVRAAADADEGTQCLVVDVDAAANAVSILL